MSTWVNVFEVAVVVLIALFVFAPRMPGAVRRVTASDSDAEGDERRRWAGRIGGVLFVLAVLNFLAFSYHSRSLGGSADKQVEGRYYVAAHGKHTEVTEEQWQAVRAHKITMYVTHALALLVAAPLIAYSQWRRE